MDRIELCHNLAKNFPPRSGSAGVIGFQDEASPDEKYGENREKELVAMFMESPFYFELLVTERLKLLQDHERRYLPWPPPSGRTPGPFELPGRVLGGHLRTILLTVRRQEITKYIQSLFVRRLRGWQVPPSSAPASDGPALEIEPGEVVG